MSRVISPQFGRFIRDQFLLDWRGIHGVAHWARVRLNGLQLARSNGANTVLVELFAFLHDCRRSNDGTDPAHGERAANFVREINGRFFSLPRAELRDLELACRDHSAGYLQAAITVQTCWDADRLDLGRIGIRPDPERLCTAQARRREVISSAYRRSVAAW
jgi:uncharacterized protein